MIIREAIYYRGCSGSRHCATSRKVAGSIPVGVIGICHGFGRSMSLGSTQPVTEMSNGVKAAGA
jgi:hypothetical protein